MSARRLLAELGERGVEVVVDGNQLRYRPKGAITAELLERLKVHKPQLLKLLEWDGRKLEKASQRGLIIRWSEYPTWTKLHDPLTGEWHEVRASECLPSVVETATQVSEEGRRGVSIYSRHQGEENLLTEKIDHKDVRVIARRDAGKEIPPEVERENRLIDWAEALHHNAMRIAAAGVLASEGSLEKAASVLDWAGFAVPAGYFPDGSEGEFLDGRDEEALWLWVEKEAKRIEGVIGSKGFYLAATGALMDEAHPSGSGREGTCGVKRSEGSET